MACEVQEGASATVAQGAGRGEKVAIGCRTAAKGRPEGRTRKVCVLREAPSDDTTHIRDPAHLTQWPPSCGPYTCQLNGSTATGRQGRCMAPLRTFTASQQPKHVSPAAPSVSPPEPTAHLTTLHPHPQLESSKIVLPFPVRTFLAVSPMIRSTWCLTMISLSARNVGSRCTGRPSRSFITRAPILQAHSNTHKHTLSTHPFQAQLGASRGHLPASSNGCEAHSHRIAPGPRAQEDKGRRRGEG